MEKLKIKSQAKEYNTEFVGSIMTSAQIKRKVGQSWAVLKNPVYDRGMLVSAELLYYNSDKAKVLEELSKCQTGHFAMFFFGTINKNQVYTL